MHYSIATWNFYVAGVNLVPLTQFHKLFELLLRNVKAIGTSSIISKQLAPSA